MASVVARALVTVDAEKASKQDLELLKKLVMEFKDELDALGVKVDSLDKRVAAIEENLGGWKLYGELYFDANFYDSDDTTASKGLDSDFGFGRARFYLGKQISENTSFLARIDTHKDGHFAWNRLWVDTKLPWDIDFRFGRFNFDWEGDLGLYDPYTINNDGTFGDWDLDGFQFVKAWGNFSFTGVVGRNNDAATKINGQHMWTDQGDYMTYAAKLGYDAENWMLGVMGYWMKSDNEGVDLGYEFGIDNTTGLPEITALAHDNREINTYGVYGGYSFTPAIQLKGVYYFQDIDGLAAGLEDSPTAWKAILDVKQDLLKFTALWIEYSQMDNTFFGTNSYDYMGGNEMANMPFNNNTAEFWNIIANQQWNDQWSTYVRYWRADWDSLNVDDTENWTVGVRYQYTPAIQFKLEYDMIDYGTGTQTYQGDDNVIRFRTTVNF